MLELSEVLGFEVVEKLITYFGGTTLRLPSWIDLQTKKKAWEGLLLKGMPGRDKGLLMELLQVDEKQIEPVLYEMKKVIGLSVIPGKRRRIRTRR